MRAAVTIVRRWRLGASALAAVISIHAPAVAGERLVMPYECRATPSTLELIASEPREYPILGAHEQDTFTACSPSNPSRCRTWQLHRFDIDCNGERVPWLDVVGASAYQRRFPAKVLSGRMLIGMGRTWGRPRLGAGRSGDPYGSRDPFSQAQARDRVVELPPGFAPMLGLNAQFVDAPPPVAARVAPPPIDAAHVVPPVANPSRRAKLAATPAEPVPPAPVPVTARPVLSPETGGHVAATEASGAASGPPAVTILNSSDSPTPPAHSSQAAQQVAADTTTQASATPDTQSALTALPGAPSPELAPRMPAADTQPPTASGPIASSTVMGALLGVGALAVIALGAYLASRPRQRSWGSTPEPQRDIASVSLGVDAGSTTMVSAGAGPVDRSRPAGGLPTMLLPGPVALTHATPKPSSVDDTQVGVLDWLPQTREEALALLGASADAPLDVVKKIVDGLRQSWHPDHARNELDRIVREKRTTQLNVAWDLIVARSQAA